MRTAAFGDFRIDPHGRLVRAGATVPLAPKEAALLTILVSNPGRLVSKREILDRLWPEQDVSEASLTRCVHALRTALGDRGRRGRFIETLHGRGYRFVTPIEPGSDETSTRGARGRRNGVLSFRRTRERVVAGADETSGADRARARHAIQLGTYLCRLRTRTGIRRALECFADAARWDPWLSETHARLGEAELMLAIRGFDAPRAVARRAFVSFERALAIDATCGAALRGLARLRTLYERDPADGERLLRGVLARDPLDAVALRYLGSALFLSRRFDEAWGALRRARDLDPYDPSSAFDLAYVGVCTGRYDAGLDAARRLARAEPEFAAGHGLRAAAAALAGCRDEALAAARLVVSLPRSDQLALGGAGWALAVSGAAAEARQVIAALERGPGHHGAPFHIAAVAAGLGEVDTALAWLARAREAHGLLLLHATVDPRFARVRGHLGSAALLAPSSTTLPAARAPAARASPGCSAATGVSARAPASAR